MLKKQHKKTKKLVNKKINLKNPFLIVFILLAMIFGVYIITTQINYINSDAADGGINPKCDTSCVNTCDSVCSAALSGVSHVNQKGVSALNQCKNTCKNRVFVEVNLDGKNCNQVCSRMKNATRSYWCKELCPRLLNKITPTITITPTP